MLDTLPNVKLPKGGAWVDLYVALGIAVGTPLVIQSLVTASVQIAIKATEPASTDGYELLEKGEKLTIDDGTSGIWASSQSGGAINARQFEVLSTSTSVALLDGLGNPITSLKGAIDTHAADVHNIPVNEFFHYHTGISSTVAVEAASQDRDLVLASAAGFVAGNIIQINDSVGDPSFPKILSISVNTLTLDRPLDSIVAIGVIIEVINIELNQVASAGSPLIYVLKPAPGTVWHITRLIPVMTHTSAGDLGLFGNLAALANGIIIRANINGVYGTFTNWKTNADIKKDMYDVEFDSRSGGGGDFGTSGRGSFNRIGVVVRLDGDTNDQLEIMVQDDLSGLTTFKINGQGHVEGA